METDNCSLHILTGSSLVPCSGGVFVTIIHFRVAQVVQNLQDGTCADCDSLNVWEHGEDARRPSVSPGELDSVIEGRPSSSRSHVPSFVWGGKGEAQLESHWLTFSWFVISVRNRHCSGTCANSPAPCCSKTRTGRSAIWIPFSSQMRTGSGEHVEASPDNIMAVQLNIFFSVSN